MKLFTTRLSEIEEKIQVLQAEQKKFIELEDATVDALDSLKFIAEKLRNDTDAIASLKSAVMNLFSATEVNIEFKSSVAETHINSEMEVSSLSCPASLNGECINPECESKTFTCEGCGKETPYCYGGDGDEVCNDCWSKSQPELSTAGNEPKDFIHEFPTEIDAQNFIELCVSNEIACDDYHLENRIVTVINRKETCQTFLELIEARDTFVKTEVSNIAILSHS